MTGDVGSQKMPQIRTTSFFRPEKACAPCKIKAKKVVWLIRCREESRENFDTLDAEQHTKYSAILRVAKRFRCFAFISKMASTTDAIVRSNIAVLENKKGERSWLLNVHTVILKVCPSRKRTVFLAVDGLYLRFCLSAAFHFAGFPL